MNRTHTLVTSCDDCPACVYETGGRYSCERAEYRRFAEKGKSEPPDWCPLPVYTPPPEPAQPAQRQPLTDEDELSNGLAMALHDAVLIRIGKDDEATRQAIARIDKLVAKYKNEAGHGITGENT